MKRIAEHIVSEIREKSDIVSVIKDYVRLEKRGSRWIGLCPFHKEKTPSFGINEEQAFFYCFGCKKGGDVITFIKEIEACSYIEALEILAKKLGIQLQYEGEADQAWQKQQKYYECLYELYERLSATFHHLLLADSRGSQALEYIKKRGIKDDVLKRFRIGYAPKDRRWLHDFLISKSFSEEFLKKSGLFSKTYSEFSIFSDRLMFPIQDNKGRTVAFGGRLLSGDGPKYINSPETAIYKKNENLFGLSLAVKTIKDRSEAILCEGYMDCISFHSAGLDYAVAPLGTSFTENQAALLKRYAATVIISFDSDVAGNKATEKAFNICFASGLASKVLLLSKGKDASEVLEKFGPDELKKNILSIITSDKYILEKSASMLIEGDSGSKAAAFKYIFAYLSNISSAITRDDFLETAAVRLGADPASIREDYKHFLNKNYAREEESQIKTANSGFVADSESEFLFALIAAPELYSKIRNEIEVQDMENTDNKEAFFALEESFRAGDMSMASILAKISNEAFRNFIIERISLGIYSIKAEKFVLDGLYQIKERILNKKKQRLLGLIRNYNHARDGEALSMNDLLYEKMYLDEQLARIKEERNERN